MSSFTICRKEEDPSWRVWGIPQRTIIRDYGSIRGRQVDTAERPHRLYVSTVYSHLKHQQLNSPLLVITIITLSPIALSNHRSLVYLLLTQPAIARPSSFVRALQE